MFIIQICILDLVSFDLLYAKPTSSPHMRSFPRSLKSLGLNGTSDLKLQFFVFCFFYDSLEMLAVLTHSHTLQPHGRGPGTAALVAHRQQTFVLD